MQSCFMLIMVFNMLSSRVTVQSAFVHLMSLMHTFHASRVCAEQEVERENKWESEREVVVVVGRGEGEVNRIHMGI